MSLSDFLKKRGLNNNSVCKKANIAESTLSQFINGKRGLNLDTACKIADALEITLDEFRELTKGDGDIEEVQRCN